MFLLLDNLTIECCLSSMAKVYQRLRRSVQVPRAMGLIRVTVRVCTEGVNARAALNNIAVCVPLIFIRYTLFAGSVCWVGLLDNVSGAMQ